MERSALEVGNMTSAISKLRAPLVEFWKNRWEPKYLMRVRNRSRARDYCREHIVDAWETGTAKVVFEVAFGGLNERIALSNALRQLPQARYVGVDINPLAVDHARKQFPDGRWNVADITQDAPLIKSADIVYSQHVLEHCPALSPALDYMLQTARSTVLYIFFNPPGFLTRIRRRRRGMLYSNTYDRPGISRVCADRGFDCCFIDYDNTGVATKRGPFSETVLIATRKHL